jgi:hypothetical protein
VAAARIEQPSLPNMLSTCVPTSDGLIGERTADDIKARYRI